MAAPTLTGPSERLAEHLDPWMVDEAANGYPWSWLASILGGMFQDVEDVVRFDPDTDTPGWARIVSPTTAKAWQLPSLAQLAGQRLDPNLPEAAQRALLHADANKRGAPAAIKAAVASVLVGTGGAEPRVELFERVTTAYRHEVVTFDSETPDPAAVVAVLSSPLVKPTGHWFTHVVVSGWTLADMEAVYSGQTIADLEGDFSTIADLENDTP